MIVLRKKRLILTAYMILACVFTSVYVSNAYKENKTAEVSSLPASNKVIVLDARTWRAR